MIAICAFGFPVMAILSILTSANPVASLSAVFDIVIEWYIPFVAVLYVVKEERQVETIIRIIMWCALFIALAGLFEFIVQKNLYYCLCRILSRTAW